jgi:hypothetical protein
LWLVILDQGVCKKGNGNNSDRQTAGQTGRGGDFGIQRRPVGRGNEEVMKSLLQRTDQSVDKQKGTPLGQAALAKDAQDLLAKFTPKRFRIQAKNALEEPA